jgi:hypothetical protein
VFPAPVCVGTQTQTRIYSTSASPPCPLRIARPDFSHVTLSQGLLGPGRGAAHSRARAHASVAALLLARTRARMGRRPPPRPKEVKVRKVMGRSGHFAQVTVDARCARERRDRNDSERPSRVLRSAYGRCARRNIVTWRNTAYIQYVKLERSKSSKSYGQKWPLCAS